ncbi:MAG: hypothetical protein O9353_04035 [Bacteroidia bacterium]|nr:hypothetical protein [Bacteroidia bacterium]
MASRALADALPVKRWPSIQIHDNFGKKLSIETIMATLNVLQADPVFCLEQWLPNISLKIKCLLLLQNENMSSITFCKSYYLVCANWACFCYALIVLFFVLIAVDYNRQNLQLFYEPIFKNFVSKW